MLTGALTSPRVAAKLRPFQYSSPGASWASQSCQYGTPRPVASRSRSRSGRWFSSGRLPRSASWVRSVARGRSWPATWQIQVIAVSSENDPPG